MADLKVSGNLTVAGLKKRLKATFGASLSVYTTPVSASSTFKRYSPDTT